MPAWKMTVRHRSEVAREGFDDLDSALSAARARADEIVAEGPMDEVRSIRDYAPSDRVAARIEISGKGFFSPPTAGVDVRGDGSLVGFTGSMRRQTVATGGVGEVFEAIDEALR